MSFCVRDIRCYLPTANVVGLLLTPFLLVLLTSGTSVAQVDMSWSSYKIEEGLASDNVRAILPVSGEIWLGTEGGISRFDGEWVSWHRAEVFSNGAILALTRGDRPNSDTVWAGTDDGSVYSWDGSNWNFALNVDNPVQSLRWVDGQLWIGIAGGLMIWTGTEVVEVDELAGLSVHEIATQTNTVWLGTDDGLWHRQHQTWSRLSTEDGLPGNKVTAVWPDPTGLLWIGTTTGVAKRNPTTGTWEEVLTEDAEGNPYHVLALAGDESGSIWGGTDGGGWFRIVDGENVDRENVDGEKVLTSSGPENLTTSSIQAVAADRHGTVWFGTPEGAWRNDPHTWIHELEASNTVGINDITTLLVDSQDRIWVGTQGAGIRQKSNAAILSPVERESLFENRYTTVNNGLPSAFISALIEDSNGDIWSGTYFGLARYEHSSARWEQPVPLEVLPSPSVNALLAQGSDLWIGTTKGLVRYDLKSGTLDRIEQLSNYNVLAMTVNTKEVLWAGTEQNGLFIRSRDGTWLPVSGPADARFDLATSKITALAPDFHLDNGIWAGVSGQGLLYWDGETWSHPSGSSNLPSDMIGALFSDPAGSSLWIGSEGGLTRFDGRTWQTIVVEDVLPMAPITAIARSLDGRYWIGSRDGLTYYRPETTQPWIRIERFSGAYEQTGENSLRIRTPSDALNVHHPQLGIGYVAGDLHTPQDMLGVYYRINGLDQDTDWNRASEPQLIQLPPLDAPGRYVVDLQVRDLAFNYSEVVQIEVDVVPAPVTVDLPLLNPMPVNTLVLLVTISLLAVVAAGYTGNQFLRKRPRVSEPVPGQRRALRGSRPISRGFNPFISGQPIRNERMFFGRHALLQRILDTLHVNSIMIHGERRIGKTTLLYQLFQRLRKLNDPDYWFLPVFIDLQGTTQDVFFHTLMDSILDGVAALPETQDEIMPGLTELVYDQTDATTYSDRDFSRDLRSVIGCLQSYTEKVHPHRDLRLILLLDEMDVVSTYSELVQQRLRRIFMQDFAVNLGAVVAGVLISKKWDRVESPWFNHFNEIGLQPFNEEQSRALLTEPVKDVYEYEPAALGYIVEESKGRPYRLQQYGLEAVNHMRSEGRSSIQMADVKFAHHQIESLTETDERAVHASSNRTGKRNPQDV